MPDNIELAWLLFTFSFGKRRPGSECFKLVLEGYSHFESLEGGGGPAFCWVNRKHPPPGHPYCFILCSHHSPSLLLLFKISE